MAIIKETSQATGQQAIGKVIIMQGQAQATAVDGTIRALAPNSVVYADDHIITGSDGSLSLFIIGNPPVQLDIGRMTETTLDEDVYAPVNTTPPSDVMAEVSSLQEALLRGEDPTDMEAPAAGPGAGGALGGAHPIVNFSLTADEVTPESGAETIGVQFGIIETIKSDAIIPPPPDVEPLPPPDITARPDLLGAIGTVYEAHLSNGTFNGDTHEGHGINAVLKYEVDLKGGALQSFNIGGEEFTWNGTTLTGGVPGNISMNNGIVTGVSYDSATNILTVEYTLTTPYTHSQQGGEELPDTAMNAVELQVSVTSSGGTSNVASGFVDIVDDMPVFGTYDAIFVNEGGQTFSGQLANIGADWDGATVKFNIVNDGATTWFVDGQSVTLYHADGDESVVYGKIGGSDGQIVLTIQADKDSDGNFTGTYTYTQEPGVVLTGGEGIIYDNQRINTDWSNNPDPEYYLLANTTGLKSVSDYDKKASTDTWVLKFTVEQNIGTVENPVLETVDINNNSNIIRCGNGNQVKSVGNVYHIEVDHPGLERNDLAGPADVITYMKLGGAGDSSGNDPWGFTIKMTYMGKDGQEHTIDVKNGVDDDGKDNYIFSGGPSSPPFWVYLPEDGQYIMNVDLTTTVGGSGLTISEVGGWTSEDLPLGPQDIGFTVTDGDGDAISGTLVLDPRPGDESLDVSASTEGYVLAGGAGDDILIGGAGDDILIGGEGYNEMTGGLGADKFVISDNSSNLIMDYSLDEGDRLDISNVLRDPGDYLHIGADDDGKLRLSIMDSSDTEKASVTFDDISYDGHGFTGGAGDADLLNSLVNVDYTP